MTRLAGQVKGCAGRDRGRAEEGVRIRAAPHLPLPRGRGFWVARYTCRVRQRLLSLDVFRGLTVAGMVLVNNPGTWRAVSAAPACRLAWLHADRSDLSLLPVHRRRGDPVCARTPPCRGRSARADHREDRPARADHLRAWARPALCVEPRSRDDPDPGGASADRRVLSRRRPAVRDDHVADAGRHRGRRAARLLGGAHAGAVSRFRPRRSGKGGQPRGLDRPHAPRRPHLAHGPRL